MPNVPWNKGRLTGQKRPLKPKDVWAIRVRLQLQQRARDLALFNLAIVSKLRGCDLVRLQVDDVCAGGWVRDRATIIQKKTGRPVHVAIARAVARFCGMEHPAACQNLLDSVPAHLAPRLPVLSQQQDGRADRIGRACRGAVPRRHVLLRPRAARRRRHPRLVGGRRSSYRRGLKTPASARITLGLVWPIEAAHALAWKLNRTPREERRRVTQEGHVHGYNPGR
jgi:hypothetical protein